MSKKISYPKEVRDAAKEAGCGMATVSIVFPDGSRIDEQRACASLAEPQFLKWALAAAACEELRGRIDLEAIVQAAADKSQIETFAPIVDTSAPDAR